MAHIGSIVPAYGRDYKSAKAAKEAWAEGKDFIIQNMFSPDDGRYVNIDDLAPGDTAELRYKNLTGVTIVKGRK